MPTGRCSSTRQRWHDFHLKGVKNGIDSEAPVQIFYMGDQQVARRGGLADCRHPLHAVVPAAGRQAGARRHPRVRERTTYRYDPNDPVPTTGGNNCCGSPTIAGPVDQEPLDARADIVRFTSDPLTEPLTIAGPVKMDLHATTDGQGHRLDGEADRRLPGRQGVPDGRRASCGRASGTGSTSRRCSPRDRRTATRIDMVGTALVFQPGHRIRVDITSSNFPQFDRNLNTGDPLGKGTQPRVAQQTIHHSASKPSAIILPVVKGFPGGSHTSRSPWLRPLTTPAVRRTVAHAHSDRPALAVIVAAGALRADLAGQAPADQPKAFIDGTGPGWRTLGPNDFAPRQRLSGHVEVGRRCPQVDGRADRRHAHARPVPELRAGRRMAPHEIGWQLGRVRLGADEGARRPASPTSCRSGASRSRCSTTATGSGFASGMPASRTTGSRPTATSSPSATRSSRRSSRAHPTARGASRARS